MCLQPAEKKQNLFHVLIIYRLVLSNDLSLDVIANAVTQDDELSVGIEVFMQFGFLVANDVFQRGRSIEIEMRMVF